MNSHPLYQYQKPTHHEDNSRHEKLNNHNEHRITEKTPAKIQEASTQDEQSTPPIAQQSAPK